MVKHTQAIRQQFADELSGCHGYHVKLINPF